MMIHARLLFDIVSVSKIDGEHFKSMKTRTQYTNKVHVGNGKMFLCLMSHLNIIQSQHYLIIFINISNLTLTYPQYYLTAVLLVSPSPGP